MIYKLTRREYRKDGIFSELVDANGKLIAHTLEHAYDDGKGGWEPKITPGSHTCIRGPHRLHNMTSDFITFEVTGVAGHSDLLFHWGNWNKDSEGCILLGNGIAQSSQGQMVTASRPTFEEFMAGLNGVDSFTLDVIV